MDDDGLHDGDRGSAPLIGAIARDTMSPAQRAVHDAIAGGPRGGVPLPFLAMLDAPDIADAIQRVGAAIRFSGALTPRLREIAILSTAAAFGSGYEWDYHVPLARAAGVSERTIAVAAAGRAEAADEAVCAAIIALCHAAVRTQRIQTFHLQQIIDAVGRTAASEVVAIVGYYQLLGLFLSAARLEALSS